MPDIKTVLTDEIRRLARKEIKIALEDLKTSLSAQKQAVSALTQKVRQLEAICRNGIAPEIVEKATAPRKHRAFKPDGKKISAIRKKLKLSQKDFALLLGVNQITVSHWELGRNVPRDAQRQALQQAAVLRRREALKLVQSKAAAKQAAPAAPAPAAAPEAK